MSDNINPNYYSGRKCLDIIAEVTKELSGELAFDIGTAIKYLYRFKGKNGVEDLKKAKKYIEFAIEFTEKHEVQETVMKKVLQLEELGYSACEMCKHFRDSNDAYPCSECKNGIKVSDPKQKDAPLLWEEA